jgi:hypothetical protein
MDPIFKVILLAVGIMLLVFIGLALQMIFKKGGRFPDTHIGSNKYMKANGVSCAQTYDKIEQAKVLQKNRLKNVALLEKDGKSR